MIGCGRWPRAPARRLDEGAAGFDLAPDETIGIAPHERHASLGSPLDEVEDRGREGRRDTEHQPEPDGRLIGIARFERRAAKVQLRFAGRLVVRTMGLAALLDVGGQIRRGIGVVRGGRGFPQADGRGVRVAARPGRSLVHVIGRGRLNGRYLVVRPRMPMDHRRRATRRVEHGRRRRRGRRGIGRPHPGARHAREQHVDRAVGDLHRPIREAPRLRRAATCRSRLRRNDKREERTVLVVQGGHRGLPGAGDVARPPARLGEVDEPVLVERVPAGQGLELGPCQRQRPEPQVQPRQGEVRTAGRDAAVLCHAHQDGSRRCFSSPRR